MNENGRCPGSRSPVIITTNRRQFNMAGEDELTFEELEELITNSDRPSDENIVASSPTEPKKEESEKPLESKKEDKIQINTEPAVTVVTKTDRPYKPLENAEAENVRKRINQVKAKTEQETLERVAKENGFENYQAMQKSKELKLFAEKGLEESAAMEVFNKLFEDRKKTDPDFIELQKYKEVQANKWAEDELKKFNELTGLTYKLEDLPTEVFTDAKNKKSLTKALMGWKGDEVLKAVVIKKAAEQNGTAEHLKQISSGSNESSFKQITPEAMRYYKSAFPNMSEDDIKKKSFAKTTGTRIIEIGGNKNVEPKNNN
jgi:hypothetical protein